MSHPPHCLFVYPKFTAQSFWNYKEACELLGKKYPTSPLGLVTVAAMVPPAWRVKLVDLNVEKLKEKEVEWAELVFIGGMIFQQPEHLRLIDYFKSRRKKVIVGGPDPTSSPHLYDKADYLVLGEEGCPIPRNAASPAICVEGSCVAVGAIQCSGSAGSTGG